jgi:hypothetical protein
MIKDKVNQIIETLLTITKNDTLVWMETDPTSKERKHKRNMFSIGEDGTKYEVEMSFRLDNSGSWNIEKEPSLWIRNLSLPNGCFYVYGGTYNLKDLRDLIRSKYCSDMNPSAQDVEDALGEIAKGISVVELRDSKLNKILNVFGINKPSNR